MPDDPYWERVPRWRAVIHYRSKNGLIDLEHFFEELAELHDIVERGPSFCAIEKVEIRCMLMLTDCARRRSRRLPTSKSRAAGRATPGCGGQAGAADPARRRAVKAAASGGGARPHLRRDVA